MSPRRLTQAGYGILAAALLIRLASVYFYPLSDRLYSDMANYARIADDLRQGIWKPTHFFQAIGFSYVVYLFKSNTSDLSQAPGIYQSIIATMTLWGNQPRRALVIVWGWCHCWADRTSRRQRYMVP
jgi:hypothetical protein